MIILGLTGGIGSGKSLVASYFNRFVKAVVFDADNVVNNLYNFDNNVIELVKSYFPTSVNNGVVDKNDLKHYFLLYDDLWIKFQSELHSIVWKIQKNFILSNSRRVTKYVVLDVPLLIEANYHNCCDFIIHIKANSILQRQRLLKRGMSRHEFELISRLQLSDNDRKRLSDFTIRTGLSKNFVVSQVKDIVFQIDSKVGCKI
ncbi:dephospho-CoA kinase [Ehrlichia ruminantium]|uniref:Dephospho-CoA kinase n=1 Tax=Ehrlichia ruminantium TaxID=779 RepID=A0A170SP87_EHRRU|nr:dephospho-CoA kinase [Ehrlichia ruminantium]GAT75139.1 dephospho-CoA kinase [Ehrlichia ruminantium]GAT77133.1 dephospho-CoA kinase [Ehrlichia ruminantium]GAT78208.1 dephospho-CoA kinase [Ehrlichia ruminantium]